MKHLVVVCVCMHVCVSLCLLGHDSNIVTTISNCQISLKDTVLAPYIHKVDMVSPPIKLLRWQITTNLISHPEPCHFPDFSVPEAPRARVQDQ